MDKGAAFPPDADSKHPFSDIRDETGADARTGAPVLVRTGVVPCDYRGQVVVQLDWGGIPDEFRPRAEFSVAGGGAAGGGAAGGGAPAFAFSAPSDMTRDPSGGVWFTRPLDPPATADAAAAVRVAVSLFTTRAGGEAPHEQGELPLIELRRAETPTLVRGPRHSGAGLATDRPTTLCCVYFLWCLDNSSRPAVAGERFDL